MKLHLDATLCQGYGLCHEQAPDLLDLDEWGYAGLRPEAADVPQEHRVAAEAAARICPAKALRLA
ncbi:ferredoxin [Streptacidiphilus rugosus]|uniref:ferredoxin n=1 Tax=Streptacidiphilus rugosus TaxID=405783 RepID=UPI00056D93AA|nr:ferredoxin [Streptacidiphilus rugosus]